MLCTYPHQRLGDFSPASSCSPAIFVSGTELASEDVAGVEKMRLENDANSGHCGS